MKDHSSTRKVALLTFLLAVMVLTGLPEPVAAADPPELKHIQQAKAYRDKGQLKSAVIELKNALQKNPENPEARHLLGQTYLELKQGAAAEKELRRARKAGLEPAAATVPLAEALLLQAKFSELLEQIKAGEDLPEQLHTQVHILRGDAWLGSADLGEAEKAYRAALQLAPKSARALVGLGRVLMVQGQSEAARDHIQQALDNDPDSPQAWNILGDLERSQGNSQAAEAAYTKAIQQDTRQSAVLLKRALLRIDIKDFESAAADIQAVKKIAQNHPGADYAEGLLNFRQQRFSEAETYFQKVLAKVPNHLNSIYFYGASQFALKNFELVEEYLSRFLTAVPQSDDAAKLLGITRMNLKEYAGAEAALTPAVERRPDDVLLLRTLAKALLAQGKNKEGNEYLQRAVAIAPESAPERMELAVSHLRMGERDLGLQALQQATKIDPGLLAADLLIIRERLQAGEFDAALEAAERLREKRPESPDPVTLRGLAYLGKGEREKARVALEEALQMQPGNSNAAINLAAMEAQAGNIDKARNYYEAVIKQNPGHLAALLKLARLEAEQGNKQASRARLEAALNANPESLVPRIEMARSRIGEGKPLNALTTLRDVEGQHADDPRFLIVKGEAQLAAGEGASAAQTLEKLIELQPDSANNHYMLGSAYVSIKKSAAAKKALFKGLALDPKPLMASQLMTWVVSMAPNLEEKDKLVRELKTLQPHHPQVLDLEAQLAIKHNDAAKAVAIYEQIHERFPDEPVWVRQLAKAQWQAGDHEDQVSMLKEWLNKHPEDITTANMLTNSYRRLERLDQARTAFTNVVERAPENVTALNNLAWLLRDENPQKALAYAEKAHELTPGNAAVIDTLGMILLQQGEAGRALGLLEKASTRLPDQPSVQYHYAMALDVNGKQDQSRTTLRRILKEDFPEREEAQALLKKLEE